jgi:hypothetical protein
MAKFGEGQDGKTARVRRQDGKMERWQDGKMAM